MGDSLPYQIALTMVPKLGPVHGRLLLEYLSPEEIFKAPLSVLSAVEKLGAVRASAILQFNNWKLVEEEMLFMERNHIDPLFIGSENYPHRLVSCPDAPLLLYTKGAASLNAERMLAVVGTRRNTDYGRKSTEKLIEDLREAGVTIVSGMAYGIDTIAHRTALLHQLPTVGVLAHGLDRIYPASNRVLAREILKEGNALLTENRKGAQADKYLFPRRNRIVAGITDATVIIESDLKGGSLITASLASDYNREVFAVPGRWSDTNSKGCLELIKSQRALLLTSAEDLLDWMGWKETNKESTNRSTATNDQPQLKGLSEEEGFLYQLIAKEEEISFDMLAQKSGWSVSQLASTLLNVELAGLIVSLPSNRYQVS